MFNLEDLDVDIENYLDDLSEDQDAEFEEIIETDLIKPIVLTKFNVHPEVEDLGIDNFVTQNKKTIFLKFGSTSLSSSVSIEGPCSLNKSSSFNLSIDNPLPKWITQFSWLTSYVYLNIEVKKADFGDKGVL